MYHFLNLKLTRCVLAYMCVLNMRRGSHCCCNYTASWLMWCSTKNVHLFVLNKMTYSHYVHIKLEYNGSFFSGFLLFVGFNLNRFNSSWNEYYGIALWRVVPLLPVHTCVNSFHMTCNCLYISMYCVLKSCF